MRSKNRKVKVIGLAGILVAGLGAGGLPAESVSAANGWEIDLNAGSDEAEASSVTISLGAETSSVTLNAKNPSKLQGIIKKTANVTIGATDGYTIKVSGNPNLTSGGNTIQGVSGATTLNQMSNRWGWYYADGNTDCSESASYKGMSSAGETVGGWGIVVDYDENDYDVFWGENRCFATGRELLKYGGDFCGGSAEVSGNFWRNYDHARNDTKYLQCSA